VGAKGWLLMVCARTGKAAIAPRLFTVTFFSHEHTPVVLTRRKLMIEALSGTMRSNVSMPRIQSTNRKTSFLDTSEVLCCYLLMMRGPTQLCPESETLHA
jgi:hypothetical protein